MPRRLKLTLVYFGLVEDPELESYLRHQPKNVWRVAAVTIFLVVAAALAVGVALQLYDLPTGLAGLVIGSAVSFASFKARQRQVRQRDEQDV